MFRVVKYGASWCSACKELERRFERTDIHCEVIYKYCDEDSVAAECAVLNIKRLPTVILYKYDKEINNIIDNIVDKN